MPMSKITRDVLGPPFTPSVRASSIDQAQARTQAPTLSQSPSFVEIINSPSAQLLQAEEQERQRVMITDPASLPFAGHPERDSQVLERYSGLIQRQCWHMRHVVRQSSAEAVSSYVTYFLSSIAAGPSRLLQQQEADMSPEVSNPTVSPLTATPPPASQAKSPLKRAQHTVAMPVSKRRRVEELSDDDTSEPITPLKEGPRSISDTHVSKKKTPTKKTIRQKTDARTHHTVKPVTPDRTRAQPPVANQTPNQPVAQSSLRRSTRIRRRQINFASVDGVIDLTTHTEESSDDDQFEDEDEEEESYQEDEQEDGGDDDNDDDGEEGEGDDDTALHESDDEL